MQTANVSTMFSDRCLFLADLHAFSEQLGHFTALAASGTLLARGPLAAAPTPGAYSSSAPTAVAEPPLVQSAYPDARFWDHASWKASKDASDPQGDSTSKINKRLMFLVDGKGRLLTSTDIDAMMTTFTEILYDMRTALSAEVFPLSWGQAGKTFKDSVIATMMEKCVSTSLLVVHSSRIVRHFALRLCSDNWKAREFCKVKWSDWSRTHHPTNPSRRKQHRRDAISVDDDDNETCILLA